MSETSSNLSYVNGVPCEQSLIGCCILGGTEIFVKVADTITEAVFATEAYRKAFELMARLVRDGNEVDTASVMVAWKQQFDEKAPDCVWRSPEPEFTASSLNWPYYKSILVEDYQKRLLAEQARKVLEMACDPVASAAQTQELMEAATVETGVEYRTKVGAPLARDTITAIEESYERQGALAGVSAGLESIDRVTDGLEAKDLSILAARPSEGKTALGLSMARLMAFHKGVSVLFISLEMPEKAIMSRLTAMDTGIPFRSIRKGSLTERDIARCGAFAATIKESPFGIVDGSSMPVGEIGRIIRNNVKTRGVQVVIIDYIQIIRHEGKAERRTEQIAEVAKTLKHFAKQNNVHILALAQVNRESAKENRPPKIHEIAESDSVETNADLVLLLHRPKGEDNLPGDAAKLIVAKQRNGGKAVVELMFNGPLVRFEEPDRVRPEDYPRPVEA